MLIEQSLDVERDLVERGNVIRRPFEYRFALMRDSDGDITSVMGAAVHKEGGALAVVDLDIPVVNKLIFASQNCSLADRVRVFSELVCLYCQFIRSAGGVGCFSSDLIRLAREAIRALAVVTAEYRNNQGGDRSDGSN